MRKAGWLGAWERKGIRLRATLAAVLVVAMALVGGGLIVVATLRQALTQTATDTAVESVQDVSTQIASDDLDGIRPLVEGEPSGGALIQVTSGGATVIASPTLTGLPPLAEGLPTQPGVVSSREIAMPVSGGPYVLAWTSATAKDGRTVVVAAAQSLERAQRVYRTVAVVILIGVPMLLVAVGVVTWAAVSRSLHSVGRITGEVAEIERAHAGARVQVPVAHDEIAQLAVTMNGMLDRLQESAESQRRFVADASHELRSPLASMRASLDVAAAADTPESWRQAQPILGAEVDRMTRLVEELLILARADEGGLALRRGQVDLDDLLAEEAARLGAQSRLAVTFEGVPVQIMADPDRIGQAVRNLVDNAARFARSSITLRLGTGDGWAVIGVEDDGPGVPAQQRDAILGRFVRLDGHRARGAAEGGAGLGLAITDEIARIHGGHLEMGDSPSGGLSISLYLPLAAPSSTSPPSPGSSR